MTDLLTLAPHLELLIAAALLFAGWWRLTNSRGSVTWDIRTREPERDATVERLTMERDEARRIAEGLR